MKRVNLLLNLSVLLFISACCGNENVKCTNGKLGIHVVGTFQTGAPLIIRYRQNNAFDVVIDTLVGSYVPVVGTDNAFLSLKSIDSTQPGAYLVTDSFGQGLVLGYDYKIIFPEDTLTWSITSLNATGSDHMEMSHCGDKAPPACTKNAYNCVLNSTTITTVAYPSTGYQPFTYINLVR